MELNVTHKDILQALRVKMQAAGIDVYVIPSGDFHGSEYLSDHFRCMRFVSGFTGSAGTLVITPGEAWLWTDGRYFIQAERQIAGSGFGLMRMAQAGVPTVEEYLKETVKDGQTLGFDGRVVTAKLVEGWEKALAGKNAKLAPGRDLAGEIWAGREPQDFHDAFILEEKYTGESADAKIARVRAEMKKCGADVHYLTSLDDIAWLLNIRGGDLPHTPVVFGFIELTADACVFYCRQAALNEDVKTYLRAQGITLAEYEWFWDAVPAKSAGKSVLYDPVKTAYRVKADLAPDAVKIEAVNPTTLMKCVKNETEQRSMREAHRKDGIAMVKWLYWLYHQADPESLSEIDVSDKLEQCRRDAGAFDLSFDTIAAMGPNAAMMHYKATPESFAMLKREGFLLVDSGGQYKDGSTDITRTMALGPVTEEQKRHYTAVLKSMLRLGAAKFLKGCTCYFLDILARGPVWDLGIDYRCGTGHGIGFVLNVHEGPNGFRWSKPATMDGLVTLEAGMVTTDEPGVYIEGSHGIRIENELLCMEDEENEYGRFMRFEHLTLCPIDLAALLPEELSPEERRALNAYHAMVYERLKDGLTAEEAAWLKEVTQPV
ncbi:MAG: aminopeptidase P family protein [Lachnospiraceae bacterium]|nr:aminopeptidase P family protein [Lachnospiraceae bacterium]